MAQPTQFKGTLNLLILEAENLKKTDWTKMDPYCVVEFKNHSFKTVAAKKGHQNPIWHTTLEIPLRGVDPKDKICFKVIDKERIKDHKIGKGEITFGELFDCSKTDNVLMIPLFSFGLLDKNNPAGTLKVKPSFSETLQHDNKSLQQAGSLPQGGVNQGVSHQGVGGVGDVCPQGVKYGGDAGDVGGMKHGGIKNDEGVKPFKDQELPKHDLLSRQQRQGGEYVNTYKTGASTDV